MPLTDHGEEQARQTGALLRRMKFSQVLVSPLKRALHTCELAGCGEAARIDANLSEWDYGDYEGLTPSQIHAQRPGWDVYRDGCPGGETAEQVVARAGRVIAELQMFQGQVALFSHGQFLRALAVRWIKLPIGQGNRLALDTGSLSTLGYEHNNVEAPAILLWNAVSNDLFELIPRPASDAVTPKRVSGR